MYCWAFPLGLHHYKSLPMGLCRINNFSVSIPWAGCIFRQYEHFLAYLPSSLCSAYAPWPKPLQPAYHNLAASENLRITVLPCTLPFPLLSDDCNLLSIFTGNYPRSIADTRLHSYGRHTHRASNPLLFGVGWARWFSHGAAARNRAERRKLRLLLSWFFDGFAGLIRLHLYIRYAECWGRPWEEGIADLYQSEITSSSNQTGRGLGW